MKKIFTLIFSLGLLTAAFAQDGHRGGDARGNGSSQSHSFTYQNGQPSSNNNRDYRSAPYDHSKTWNSQSQRGRDDDGRYGSVGKRKNQPGQSKFAKQAKRYHRARKTNVGTGLQIVFSFGRH